MSGPGSPPHHVDWESSADWRSHPHAELAPPPDRRERARWTRVLALGAGAFALWFLLFAPTLQHDAQVSPVGTRRTVSLDITGPVAALSRALQLSHIVSLTGRSNRLPGGTVGITGAGPLAAGSVGAAGVSPARPGTGPGSGPAVTTSTVPPEPEEPDRGAPAARSDRGRLHRPRPRGTASIGPGRDRRGERGPRRPGEHGIDPP